MSSRLFLQIRKHTHQHPIFVLIIFIKKVFFNKKYMEIKYNFHYSFQSRDALLSPDLLSGPLVWGTVEADYFLAFKQSYIIL